MVVGMTHLGVELRRQREAKFFSMSHLAGLVGCNHSAISRIENGAAAKLPFLITLAGALGEGDDDACLHSLNGLFSAWVLDNGVVETSAIMNLVTLVPFASKETRDQVEATLGLLSSYVELKADIARMADEGCPHHPED
jgi:transcriptional regulator with XRE-family HTH domain